MLLLALLFTGCNSKDELSGHTFELAVMSLSPVLQKDADDSRSYSPLLTLEFSDGDKVTSPIYDGEGTYILEDDELAIHFENENEKLDIRFALKESDKDFSMYSALLSGIHFEAPDTGEISHLTHIAAKLDGDLPIEFLEK